ncbi:MAG: DUF721 domain-containing protein [Kangiellaceae bacterium]|nr:DUF721 domain-containing protein [Kangiellaceae bacterium]
MKRPFRAKSVADILNTPDGVLKALMDKSNALDSITQDVHQFLPPELAAHCRVVNYNRQTLILGADSPVWATRLRYLSSQLLTDLRQAGHFSLGNILIQTAPNVNS